MALEGASGALAGAGSAPTWLPGSTHHGAGSAAVVGGARIKTKGVRRQKVLREAGWAMGPHESRAAEGGLGGGVEGQACPADPERARGPGGVGDSALSR